MAPFGTTLAAFNPDCPAGARPPLATAVAAAAAAAIINVPATPAETAALHLLCL